MWNSLPDGIVNFDSLYKFKHSLKRVNFSHYLRFSNRFSVFTCPYSCSL